MHISDVDVDKLSPMMREYVKTKEKYKDVILFYRLGDFYEMFFEDALTVSHELELTLTGKNAGLKERVPMCGIPYHAREGYLEKLIDKGYKVAICEQVEDPSTARGLVKREVVQIVSKGTLTSTEAMNEKDFNYIASVSDYKHAYALSYADLLSGILCTTYISHDKDKLISYLVNLNIKELVVNSDFDKSIINVLKNNYNVFISFEDESDIELKRNLFKNIDDIKLINNTKILIKYLENSQKKSLEHIREAVYINNKLSLELDKECIRNLELVSTLRNNDRMYSLLWFLDKTKTAMGGRLLKSYVISPTIVKEEIEKRHDLIELLNSEFLLKSELKEFLYGIYDLERLTGKLVCGNVNARDLLQLKISIGLLPEINNILDSLNLEKLETFEDLYSLLDQTIVEDAPITLKEGNIIKEGFNEELDNLREIKRSGKDFLLKFEMEERERTGIKNLKIGYNKVFGYYIEISKGQVKMIPPEFGYERKQTISNSERFITPLLKEKENLILNAEDKINALEYNIFLYLKEEIKKYIPKLQSVSALIAYYDVMQSLSTVAEENNFVRPTLTEENEIKIIDGRHPVVEKVIKNEYVKNDIIMDKDTNILLITGPNMSGKSTYMRQLAIIIILNQIGSFVPASEATLPIFDKIFTRIGASDDLVGGESTFMVEMKESARALTNATKNSLILFDELGRGTSTYDGMALAEAIIIYINKHIRCKTLFSTHYHELTLIANDTEGVKNVHVSAKEENDNITFLHKVKDGAVDKSYGIGVAKLASLPEEVIDTAKKILKEYEKKDKQEPIATQIEMDFDFKEKDELREFIKEINPLEVTPMEAIMLLDEIKKKSEKE